MTTILENANGVRITEGDKMHGHHIAVNEINNRAKAEGYKRGQRVEIQL